MWFFRALDRERPAPSSYDAEAKLKCRVVSLYGAIDDEQTNRIVAHLLWLHLQDTSQPIFLEIESPGGSVSAAMAIADTMTYVSTPVCTLCGRRAQGVAAYLAACGHPGQRFATAHSDLSLFPLEGRIPDSETATQFLQVQQTLAARLAKACGQPLARVAKDLQTGRELDAPAALAYGLVDVIVE